MRITTSMLAQTSRETGIPIAQGSLLDALNNQNHSVNLLDALNKNQNTKKLSAMQKEYRELGSEADDLSQYAWELTQTGANSLFGKAEDSQETEAILSGIKDMVESYNKTLGLLKEAEGSLNSFYYRELKNAAAVSAQQLESVGITQNKDGTLTMDEKMLNAVDYDTLKKVFGSDSDFSQRTEYISGKVSENAQANMESISNQYNANGVAYSNSVTSNKYNFFG